MNTLEIKQGVAAAFDDLLTEYEELQKQASALMRDLAKERDLRARAEAEQRKLQDQLEKRAQAPAALDEQKVRDLCTKLHEANLLTDVEGTVRKIAEDPNEVLAMLEKAASALTSTTSPLTGSPAPAGSPQDSEGSRVSWSQMIRSRFGL